jgi:hypothetical protein
VTCGRFAADCWSVVRPSFAWPSLSRPSDSSCYSSGISSIGRPRSSMRISTNLSRASITVRMASFKWSGRRPIHGSSSRSPAFTGRCPKTAPIGSYARGRYGTSPWRFRTRRVLTTACTAIKSRDPEDKRSISCNGMSSFRSASAPKTCRRPWPSTGPKFGPRSGGSPPRSCRFCWCWPCFWCLPPGYR